MGFSNEHYKDIINSAKVELEKWNAAPEDFKKRSIEMGMDLGKWYTDMIEACKESMEPEDKSEHEDTVNAPSAEALAKGAFGDEHFGEQQAEGLDNLLEGLRDTPHDSRW